MQVHDSELLDYRNQDFSIPKSTPYTDKTSTILYHATENLSLLYNGNTSRSIEIPCRFKELALRHSRVIGMRLCDVKGICSCTWKAVTNRVMDKA